jgi:hypothetical protein
VVQSLVGVLDVSPLRQIRQLSGVEAGVMNQVIATNICSLCFKRLRWWHRWVGTKRFAAYAADGGFWIERAHYSCWYEWKRPANRPGVDSGGRSGES